jgi:hypothetical protein
MSVGKTIPKNLGLIVPFGCSLDSARDEAERP